MRVTATALTVCIINLVAYVSSQWYGSDAMEQKFDKRGLVRDIVDVITSRNTTSLNHENRARRVERHGAGNIAYYEPSFASYTVGLRSKNVAKSTRKKLDVILKNILALKKDLKSRDEFNDLSLEKKRNEILRATAAWNAVKQDYQELTDEEWANLAAWTKEKKAKKLQQFHDDIYEEFLHTKAFILDYRRNYERELRKAAWYALDGGTSRESMAETQALGLLETRLR